MSIEAVNQFLQKVSEDPKLQDELAKVLESQNNDRAGATALAAKYGYEFTPEELWQEIQHRQSEFQSSQASGELSDEELESVAGGATPVAVIGAIGVITGGAAGNAKW